MKQNEGHVNIGEAVGDTVRGKLGYKVGPWESKSKYSFHHCGQQRTAMTQDPNQ